MTERRGRSLDPKIDRLIIEAAVKEFVSKGFQRLSVEGVARTAGVAKTTVYRRYADRMALARIALAQLIASDPPIDTGSARTDLLTLLEQVRQRFDLAITGTLLVEERENPQLLDAFRETMITPAIDRFRNALRAGVERGELREDLDVAVAAELILGAFFVRYFERGRPGPEWPAAVVEAAWPALI
jgi:AcrR family transcriptional regulator